MATKNAPSAAPVRKVTAAGLGGALATIAVAAIDAVNGAADVPGTLGAAIGTVCAFVAGYLVPAATGE